MLRALHTGECSGETCLPELILSSRWSVRVHGLANSSSLTSQNFVALR